MSHASTSDRARFEELILPHLGAAHAFAQRLTRDPAAADDVTQEALLRAYRFFHQFRPGTNAKAWLFRIVRNTFISGWRRTKARPTSVEFEVVEEAYDSRADAVFGSGEASPEDVLDGALIKRDVVAAFEEMPDAFRDVAWCCLVEGLKYQETADLLEVPIGTVMSRLHRARKFLQSRLLERAVELGLPNARQAREEEKPDS